MHPQGGSREPGVPPVLAHQIRVRRVLLSWLQCAITCSRVEESEGMYRYSYVFPLGLNPRHDGGALSGGCHGFGATDFNLFDSISITRTQKGQVSDKKPQNQAPLLAGATRADVRSEPPHNSTC